MEGASNSFIPPRGGGGAGRGTPLYRPYKYVPPKRVGVCAVSVWKRGVDFGLDSDMVFEETAGLYVYLSFSFQMNMKEKYSNSKWILRNLFTTAQAF